MDRHCTLQDQECMADLDSYLLELLIPVSDLIYGHMCIDVYQHGGLVGHIGHCRSTPNLGKPVKEDGYGQNN